MEAQPLSIAIDHASRVSGLLLRPAEARACCVLAHGAGAGMTHPFLERIAGELARRQVATLRYQFPYMEKRSKRPDPPQIAHAAVRAAVIEAARLMPDLPLFAGGKSFGGRMTSQAQAAAPLPDVRGIVFLGFPLHPAGKPSDERAQHLHAVDEPMLFLQGTRDELASLELLCRVVEQLDGRARLELFDEADHSFHLPARSGRKDAEVLGAIADAIAAWMGDVLSGPPA